MEGPTSSPTQGYQSGPERAQQNRHKAAKDAEGGSQPEDPPTPHQTPLWPGTQCIPVGAAILGIRQTRPHRPMGQGTLPRPRGREQ